MKKRALQLHIPRYLKENATKFINTKQEVTKSTRNTRMRCEILKKRY